MTTTSAAIGTGTPATTAPATTGTPATSTTTSAPATGVTTETVNPGSWMAGFNDDLKGYVGTKGFKGPGDLAEAYRNFEKLQGVPQDRVLKLPETFYDEKGALTPEGRAIRERLGAPKDAKDYAFDLPKENADPKLMEGFKKFAMDNGLTKQDAEGVVKFWNEYQGAMGKEMAEAATLKFQQETKALEGEWGMAAEQNKNIARQAVANLGLTPQQVDGISASLGHAATMKLLHKLGAAVGEASFVGGKSAGEKLSTPDQAASEIKSLMTDKAFVSRFNSGDADAIKKIQRLNEMKTNGQVLRI